MLVPFVQRLLLLVLLLPSVVPLRVFLLVLLLVLRTPPLARLALRALLLVPLVLPLAPLVLLLAPLALLLMLTLRLVLGVNDDDNMDEDLGDLGGEAQPERQQVRPLRTP